MKKVSVAAIAALLSVCMTGCGSLAGRHNIDSGFSYIESHEYQNALESFNAASENGEDECLIHRGMGIAYLKSGEYQKASDELLLSLSKDEGIVDDMDFDTNYYLAEAYLGLSEYNKAKEVYDAILSGADGTGATSGIVAAPDPVLAMRSMVKAMCEAAKEKQRG